MASALSSHRRPEIPALLSPRPLRPQRRASRHCWRFCAELTTGGPLVERTRSRAGWQRSVTTDYMPQYLPALHGEGYEEMSPVRDADEPDMQECIDDLVASKKMKKPHARPS